MKVLESFTGAVKSDIQIQTSVAKLLFIVQDNTYADLGKNVEDVLSKIHVRIDKAGPRGQKQMVPKIPLRVLAEKAAINEGFIFNITSEGVITAKCTVDLTDDGYLACFEQEYLSLTVESELPDYSMTIHALDSPTKSETFIHYDPVLVNSITKDIPLDNADGIIFPLDGEIDEINFEFEGKSFKYNEEELKAVMRDINDIAYGGTYFVFGHGRYGVFEFEKGLKMTVTPKISTPFTVWVMRETKF